MLDYKVEKVYIARGVMSEKINTYSKGMPVTRDDVAKAAGVSTGTVSLSLRNDPRVRPTTRKLVLMAAKQLNYRPRASASALARGKTYSIGVVFAYLPFIPGALLISAYSKAINEIGRLLMARRYHMSFASPMLTDLDSAETPVPRMFDEISVDGLLVVQQPGREMQRSIEELHVPYVILDAPPQDGVFSVSVDECRAAELAVEHLVKLGHRKIAYTSGPRSVPLPEGTPRVFRADQFMRGYIRGLTKFGLPAMSGWDEPLPILEHMDSLWKLPESPTAVVTYEGINCREINSWLLQRGMSVPKDVSLVGLHDGIGVCEPSWPPLPAITMGGNMQEQMAKIAVNKLLHLIEHPAEKLEPVVLEPKLVIRESTGPCPSS